MKKKEKIKENTERTQIRKSCRRNRRIKGKNKEGGSGMYTCPHPQSVSTFAK